MSGLVRQNFESPEETRPFEQDKGRVDVVDWQGFADYAKRP
ncbi:hypothetical protein [Nocardia xishanensis]